MTHHPQSLLILGTRGVPASHGGFETFAEHLALFLTERGWTVSVYCQEDVLRVERRLRSDRWKGVERIIVQVASRGPQSTLEFDWHCARDAASRPGLCLVLGYNGAVFLPWLRLRGRRIMTNMDGIEWRRAKWSASVRAWFWINEWIAAWSSHRLVADHPVIADHLATRRPRDAIAMIPYGAAPVLEEPDGPVGELGLRPGGYLLLVARIEPDNSILPIVQAFSSRRRGAHLVVVGRLDHGNAYHREIRAAASDEVLFSGAIYDAAVLRPLRFHARGYVHGHTVGGTNPSLVEALWAGNAVLAHDNSYNRWTAGEAALFFGCALSCDGIMTTLLTDDAVAARLSAAARLRAADGFTWSRVLGLYEKELLAMSGAPLQSAAWSMQSSGQS